MKPVLAIGIATVLAIIATGCEREARRFDKAPVGSARLEGHLDLMDGLWSSEDQRSRCLVLLSRMRGQAGEHPAFAALDAVAGGRE